MPDQHLAHITTKSLLHPALLGWEMFLNDQGRSPHTIKAFLGDLRLFVTYLPPDQTIGSISINDINSFLEWMEKIRGVPCSPKTLARRITSIKAFFRWLEEGGVILVNPAEKVIQKSVISPTPTVLWPAEMKLILDVANKFRYRENPDIRYFTLVRLLLSTAIKKGECLNLKINHIGLESPEGPFVFVRYANTKHRYKERKILIPNDWVEAFHQYKSEYDLSERLFPWSPRRLEYLLEDLSKEADLDKHLSFDMCRWTSALNDWLSGMEPEKIRQKLGVSKVQWREIRMKLRKLSKMLPEENGTI
jgi:integrase/recombinase XerD